MRYTVLGSLLLGGVVAGVTAALRPAVRSTAAAPAPELTNASWLNADRPLRLAELRGRVVLLNFWVFTCGNCTRTVPSLVEYDRRYRERGLTIIGIHTPEFPPYAGEHDKGNLAPALELDGGMVLRFDSPYLTADSAYFAAPPTAALPSGPRRGTLRVSVCPSGERLCRSLEMTVAW